MGRKLDTLMEYSENLTKGFSPASKWIVKHLPVILLVLAILVFAYRSIIHHYLKGLPLGISLATAGLETLKIFTIAIIAGLIAYLILLLILALLKTLGEHYRENHEEPKSTEVQTSATEITSSGNVHEIWIDKELLGQFLNKPAMKTRLEGNDITVFDQVAATFKDMLKLHKKGSKSKGDYSDVDFIQAATLLYNRLYMNTRKVDFRPWCSACFKALGLEVPSTIRKQRPEKDIVKLFNFLPKE